MIKTVVGGLVSGVLAIGCAGEGSHEGVQQPQGQAERARISAIDLEDLTGAGVECRAYDQYTASLATLTVDCLGTIRPDAFRVNAEGRLERAFATCALDASKLSQIDGLLSLQRRTATLPRARECFAGRYADFLRSFAETGIEHCPRWTKESTVNPITASTIDAVIPALRSLETRTAAEVLHDGEPSFQAAEALEEKNLYRAAFDAETSSPSSDAGTTAVACAGGFAGFVLGHDGDSVLTDPTAWLLDTVYPSAAADPYWRNGAYYHPMSQYGTLPGALFGNVNRYRPCPGCAPEFCSYYAGSHIKTALQLDCLDDNDWATCVSYCGPRLP